MFQNYTYKFRLYPNKQQEELLAKHFGCCRFIYNYFLDNTKKEYEATKNYNTRYNNQKLLTILKKQKE